MEQIKKNENIVYFSKVENGYIFTLQYNFIDNKVVLFDKRKLKECENCKN